MALLVNIALIYLCLIIVNMRIKKIERKLENQKNRTKAWNRLNSL
jgi:hypothetical protein